MGKFRPNLAQVLVVWENMVRGGTILTFLGKKLLFISDRMVLNVV